MTVIGELRLGNRNEIRKIGEQVESDLGYSVK